MEPFVDSLAAPETGRLSFAGIAGWAQDDLAAALAAWRLNPAEAEGDARAFFERAFRPGEPVDAHLTGYFEPELDASAIRSAQFPVPIHALPDGGCDTPRAGADAALAGHEIAWLRDPVDRFLLQVQGSGRLRLTDGRSLRVGFAGTNGHPYRSIGRMLVESGDLDPDITADRLAEWLRADPERGRSAMEANPSYVMFRPLDLPEGSGPPGTLCPVTAGRSIAVDPAHIALGTPVWVEGPGIARLCIAQDTGSAIKGPCRADLFFGTGAEAGRAAGRLNHPGRLVPLVPR